jgi:hypothetical protein
MGVLAVYHLPRIGHVDDESDSLTSAHEAAVDNQPRYSKRDWTRRAIVRMHWRMEIGLLILSAVVIGVGLVLLVRCIIRA